jgi:cysteinyl-tRNA synthetase
LKYSGFRVTQVMNLTDVDDKTIRGAMAAGMSLMPIPPRSRRCFSRI